MTGESNEQVLRLQLNHVQAGYQAQQELSQKLQSEVARLLTDNSRLQAELAKAQREIENLQVENKRLRAVLEQHQISFPTQDS